jgi:hypothetical protein
MQLVLGTRKVRPATPLLRASIDLRPENGRGINLGDAPQLAENKRLFVAAHWALSEISALVHEMTVANSARFPRVVTQRSGNCEKTRDQKIVTALKGALTVELDEITPENLQFALLGTMTGAAGARVVKVFANAQVTGEVKLVQTNSIGRRFELKFGHVQVMPDQEIDFIGDDYSTIQTTLEVNLDAQGVFWTATELP